MIKLGKSNIDSIAVGKITVIQVRAGTEIIWEALTSCFAKGYWVNNAGWTNNKGWRN